MLESSNFPKRIINVWNKLSMYCLPASGVNMIKNRIDKYLDTPMASLSAAI